MRRSIPMFLLGWTIMHIIDEQGPLYGMDEAELERSDVGFVLSVQGRDENFAQEVQARKAYTWRDLRWNRRYVDIIDVVDGAILIDYRVFHDVVDASPA